MRNKRKTRFVEIQHLNDDGLRQMENRQTRNDERLVMFHNKVCMFINKPHGSAMQLLLCNDKPTRDVSRQLLFAEKLIESCSKLKRLAGKSIAGGNKSSRYKDGIGWSKDKQKQSVNNQIRNVKRIGQYVYKPALRKNKAKN